MRYNWQRDRAVLGHRAGPGKRLIPQIRSYLDVCKFRDREMPGGVPLIFEVVALNHRQRYSRWPEDANICAALTSHTVKDNTIFRRG